MNSNTFDELYHNGGFLKKRTYEYSPKNVAQKLVEKTSIEEAVKKAVEKREKEIANDILSSILDFAEDFYDYIQSNNSYSIWDFDTFKQSMISFYNSFGAVVRNKHPFLRDFRTICNHPRSDWKALQRLISKVIKLISKHKI